MDDMNRRKIRAGLTTGTAVSVSPQVNSADSTKALNIGSTKQLFLDDFLVDQMQGVYRRFHHPSRFAENPLVVGDKPWETPRRGVNAGTYLFGGTVMFDEEEQQFKMWYRTDQILPSQPSSSKRIRYQVPPGGYSTLYAVSHDGLHWEKPNLGLVEHEGSRNNNLLPAEIGGGGYIRRSMIIKDYQEKDPEKRYKILYMDKTDPSEELIQSDQWTQWGLKKAYSSDGIHWRIKAGRPIRFERSLRELRANGELFGWDPKLQRYVFFTLRSHSEMVQADVDGRLVRHEDAIARITSRDFETWGDPCDLIKRDPHCDSPQWSPGHVGVMTAILYTEELYVGFIDTVTPHAVEDISGDLWDVYNIEHEEHRTELVISRDGTHWKRIAPHWWVLPPGLWGTWDHDHVVLSKPIVRENEILIYYTGNNLPCKAQMPGHAQYDLVGKLVNGQQMGYAIGVAKLRLDGFASMEGYEPEGTLSTRALIFDGDQLVINARAPEKPLNSKPPSRGSRQIVGDPYGRLRVEIGDEAGIPLKGYKASDCDGFSGDGIAKVVTWCGKSDLSHFSGKTIRLKFFLKNAALYSLQFTGKQLKPSPINPLCPGCRGRP
jgi:hypothetical protein